MLRSFQVRALMLMETLNQQERSFGIIIKLICVQSKRAGAKNITCTFCDSTFTGCSSTRALAHILGRPVLRQKRTNVGAGVRIR